MELPLEMATSRLRLRPPRPADAAELNAAIGESFSELNAWMEWATRMPSVEETAAFCATAAEQFRQGTACPLVMFDRVRGNLVGATGYARIDPAVPAFEIGYWCRTSLTGRGYVTETTDMLARHAFAVLGANRVEIRMDDLNMRSAAVPVRLGFELEGVLRNDVRDHHGRLRNTRVYALVGIGGLKAPAQPR